MKKQKSAFYLFPESSWAEYNACLHEQLDEELLRNDAAAHQGGGMSAAVQIAAASPGYGRVALRLGRRFS